MVKNKATGHLRCKNIWSAGCGPINTLAELSLARCLKFPLRTPIRETPRFQSLLLYVSRSPQHKVLPSRFPSRNLRKERDAAFPVTLTCLLESPVKDPSPPSRFPLWSSYIERDAPFPEPSFTCLPKSLVNEPPSPPGSPAEPLWREMPVSRTFLRTSSGVSCRRTLPAGSPLRAHRERHFFSRAFFHLILRTPFRALWFSYDVNQQMHALR